MPDRRSAPRRPPAARLGSVAFVVHWGGSYLAANGVSPADAWNAAQQAARQQIG